MPRTPLPIGTWEEISATATGEVRTGWIQVPADVPVGTQLQIGIAGDGRYLPKAPTRGDTVVVPAVFGVAMLAVTILVCTLTYRGFVRLLERRRAAAWDEAWAAFAR